MVAKEILKSSIILKHIKYEYELLLSMIISIIRQRRFAEKQQVKSHCVYFEDFKLKLDTQYTLYNSIHTLYKISLL